MIAIPAQLERATAHPRWRAEAGLCAVAFAVLVGWLLVFPYTGDGDSAMHYLNARNTAVAPAEGLHAWARPGLKLVLAVFAAHGIVAARAFMAAVSTAVVWQTIRLADDLALPRAALAGPMVLWQPMAFAVAADTMTEMPMAMGLVVAVRLWLAGRLAWSCLVLGFLPTVRPEGFFFGPLWGLMVLFGPTVGPWRRRVGLLVALSIGLVAWAVTCRALIGDPWYVIHDWKWPADSYASYGRGPIYHYLALWPLYAGLPLTGLFLAGLGPSLRQRRMRLPLVAWALVLTLHSVLYWRGWFASCGLLRILACTSPFTAVVCLQGWNRCVALLADRGWTPVAQRRAGLALGVTATVWTAGQYLATPEHFDCFPLLRCTAYVREHHLIGPATWYFPGNLIETADLGFSTHRPNTMVTSCDPDQIRVALAALPLGAIGIWDNRQAPLWHGQTIDGLRANGFTVLYDTTTRVDWHDLRYVVVRKDGAFAVPVQ